MNAAHYHLIVNHIPLFTTLIGLLILGWGMIKKSQSINTIAFVLLIVGALSSYVALETGEGAEDIIEQLGISNDQAIHDHEETAELAFWFAIVTGALSIVGLFESAFSSRLQNTVNVIALLAAIITLGLLSYAAYQGGAIRHTEAYSDNAATTRQYVPELKTDDFAEAEPVLLLDNSYSALDCFNCHYFSKTDIT